MSHCSCLASKHTDMAHAEQEAYVTPFQSLKSLREQSYRCGYICTSSANGLFIVLLLLTWCCCSFGCCFCLTFVILRYKSIARQRRSSGTRPLYNRYEPMLAQRSVGTKINSFKRFALECRKQNQNECNFGPILF